MRSDYAIAGSPTKQTPAAPHATSDGALIAAIANGDRPAMQTLFARHNVRIYRFIVRLGADAASADDLVGDVFLDVWQKASRFEGRCQVSTWLMAIARNKTLDQLRRRRADQLDEAVAAAIPDPADNPAVVLEKKDRGAALRQCLQQLSPAHREVIDLVYYHERSVEEAALIVGISENTVKTRMFYARKRLAELLAAAGIDRALG